MIDECICDKPVCWGLMCPVHGVKCQATVPRGNETLKESKEMEEVESPERIVFRTVKIAKTIVLPKDVVDRWNGLLAMETAAPSRRNRDCLEDFCVDLGDQFEIEVGLYNSADGPYLTVSILDHGTELDMLDPADTDKLEGTYYFNTILLDSDENDYEVSISLTIVSGE